MLEPITHTDQDIEEFYNDITRILNNNNTVFKYVFTDINTKVGQRKNLEVFVGNFGIGDRNDEGERFIFIANSSRILKENGLAKPPAD